MHEDHHAQTLIWYIIIRSNRIFQLYKQSRQNNQKQKNTKGINYKKLRTICSFNFFLLLLFVGNVFYCLIVKTSEFNTSNTCTPDAIHNSTTSVIDIIIITATAIATIGGTITNDASAQLFMLQQLDQVLLTHIQMIQVQESKSEVIQLKMIIFGMTVQAEVRNNTNSNEDDLMYSSGNNVCITKCRCNTIPSCLLKRLSRVSYLCGQFLYVSESKSLSVTINYSVRH